MLYVEFLIDGERFELELHPGMVITKCEVRPENLCLFPCRRCAAARDLHDGHGQTLESVCLDCPDARGQDEGRRAEDGNDYRHGALCRGVGVVRVAHSLVPDIVGSRVGPFGDGCAESGCRRRHAICSEGVLHLAAFRGSRRHKFLCLSVLNQIFCSRRF